MQISSSMWLGIIVVGGVLVAFGNINYNSAKDRERGQAASEKALAMLKTEFKNNLTRGEAMRALAATSQVSVSGFETTAWTIVSNGGLLVQLQEDTLGQVSQIYYLIGVADDYRARVIDMSTGIASALQGVGTTRQQYMTLLTQTLDQLVPKLQEVTK